MVKVVCDKSTLTPGPGTYAQRAWTRCLAGLVAARSGQSSDWLWLETTRMILGCPLVPLLKNMTKSKQQNGADDSSCSSQVFFFLNKYLLYDYLSLFNFVCSGSAKSRLCVKQNRAWPYSGPILPDGLLPQPSRDPNVIKMSDRRTGQGLPSPISHAEKRRGQCVAPHSFRQGDQRQALSQLSSGIAPSLYGPIMKLLPNPNHGLYSTQHRSLVRPRKTASSSFSQFESIFLNSLDILWPNRINSSP